MTMPVNLTIQKKSLFHFLAIACILGLLLSACGTARLLTPSSPDATSESQSVTSLTQVKPPAGKNIIGYYASWVAERSAFVKDIPAGKLTHINYAFSNVSADGKCTLGDPAADVQRIYSAVESVSGTDDAGSAEFNGNFNQLLQLKQRFPHLKVLISIGGAAWSANFSAAAQDDQARQRFASSCIQLYLKQYKGVFDGLDIDWEFPVCGGETVGRREDKANFTLLLTELRRQLDELGQADNTHYLLTIAAPAGPSTIRNLEPQKIAAVVDWINVMTYDIHGTWDSTTNFNAPLFQTARDPADAGLNIDAAIQAYIAAGASPQKLTLGVPFYGYGWSGVPETEHGLYQSTTGAAPGTWDAGSYDYNDLQRNYLSTYQRYWDAEAYVPWLYDPASKTFISYDDPQSLAVKAGYARDMGLGGVMIWELSQGNETLLDAINQGFVTGGPMHQTPVASNVIMPRPFEKEIHSVSNITVDGQLNDWITAPDFVLDSQSQIVYSVAPQIWGGPHDLSAQAWVGWTPEGLYLAFNVADDTHVQATADSNLWHGDHVELPFDTLLDKDYNTSSMNDDDYQIGLSVGDYLGVPPVVYAWFNGPAKPGALTTIQMANTHTADGYTLEVFIPKDALAGITLAEGATFGMNISPSDADAVTQGQKVMLSTSPIRTYANPKTFGKITLVK